VGISRKVAFKLPALSTFGRWAAKQRPDEQYDYCDPQQCPIARFLRSLGYPKAHCGTDRFSLTEGYWNNSKRELPKLWNDLVMDWPFGSVHDRTNRTYGALAKRIKAARR
jgi:hypothetical protein